MSQSCEQKRRVMKNICEIIGDEKPKDISCHPGLWLDKFAIPCDQKKQHEEIRHICELNKKAKEHDGELLKEIHARRKKIFDALEEHCFKFTAQTTGPFTLHLARASALENAGICLHPVYGFVYIPGTAIKGMAHAFACEVWLPTQSNKQEAWDKVCKVFGWAPSPWLNKLAERHEVKVNDGASVGAIVFHDAWPLEWPELICDITNNHHPKYYSGENNMPPGDWENPIPVYFLAVKPGTEFDFALSLRSVAVLRKLQSADDESAANLLNLACQWLLGALEHRGAGAKTNTGYGRFQLKNSPVSYANLKEDADEIWRKAKENGRFCEETFILELVTPAFLAGANQEEGDCDLRPATLRGHLRWWWRTMHAGYLDVATLKKLEDAIWGSAEEGGVISIELIPKTAGNKPNIFDKRVITGRCGLEKSPNKKTTQGISYLAFGMDDEKKEERVQRYYVNSFNKWKVIFTARVVNNPWYISTKTVMEEATNAFYLLSAVGGIGAKCRNGFGSLNISSSLNVEKCRESAEKLRQSLNINAKFNDKKIFSSSIDSGLILQKEIKTPWKNVWYVIDHLGFAYQAFAQSKKHLLEKKALGLPRNIGHPARGEFKLSKEMGKIERYPSPFFFHLDLNTDQTYSIRLTAFPSPFLPDLEKSKKILQELFTHLEKDMGERVVRYKDNGQTLPDVPVAKVVSVKKEINLPKPGKLVEAILLEEKTKKGGWRAQHIATKNAGAIQNSKDVPSDKKPGDKIELIVAIANEQQIAFRYPTDVEKQRAQQLKSPKKDQRFRGGK